ncbi:DNA repair protein RecO, partial [Candidatus Deferrimicrobium sp.]|uniref:DNA repair protein RecO n=1 Tax=Candidatus Deferrimicrobium sp. TaxID=3060586 RepID=UPI002ED4387E
MIRPTFHSSPAFLVRAIDLGEADRRLTFFTRDAGVLVTVGKSAWRSRKRFGGALQRYVLLDIAWTERPGRMAVLSSASVNRSFWGIVEDWERVRHADHLLEIASELFPQAGPKPRAFEVLLRGMRSIADGEPPEENARRAEAEFLAIGGWGPDLSGCRKCGEKEGRSYRFLDSEGGVLCDACPPGGGVPLSLGAVKTWRAQQSGSTPDVQVTPDTECNIIYSSGTTGLPKGIVHTASVAGQTKSETSPPPRLPAFPASGQVGPPPADREKFGLRP